MEAGGMMADFQHSIKRVVPEGEEKSRRDDSLTNFHQVTRFSVSRCSFLIDRRER
jgi:hypothetical protein